MLPELQKVYWMPGKYVVSNIKILVFKQVWVTHVYLDMIVLENPSLLMASLELQSRPWGTTKHWRSFPPMAPSPPCEWFGPWEFWPWKNCWCHGNGESHCRAFALLKPCKSLDHHHHHHHHHHEEEEEEEEEEEQEQQEPLSTCTSNCDFFQWKLRRSSIHWSIRWCAPCPGAWWKGLAMVEELL